MFFPDFHLWSSTPGGGAFSLVSAEAGFCGGWLGASAEKNPDLASRNLWGISPRKNGNLL